MCKVKSRQISFIRRETSASLLDAIIYTGASDKTASQVQVTQQLPTGRNRNDDTDEVFLPQ